MSTRLFGGLPLHYPWARAGWSAFRLVARTVFQQHELIVCAISWPIAGMSTWGNPMSLSATWGRIVYCSPIVAHSSS